jgi:hypothetical protein
MEYDIKMMGYRGGRVAHTKMKRHKQEQNLQQFPCLGLLLLHRRFCCGTEQVFGAFCSPAQKHEMEWVGYRGGEVAHSKKDQTHKCNTYLDQTSHNDCIYSYNLS